MVIEEISAAEVLSLSRKTLGLPMLSNIAVDDIMLAALLRRAAGIFCPCSQATLISAVSEGLRYLTEDMQGLSERIEEVIESLIAAGDLLELSQVTTEDPNVKGTWVFAASPGFVVRQSGSVVLLGISSDEATALPESLNARVIHKGVVRVLNPLPSENLSTVLRSLGLAELSESMWLRAPKPEAASELRDHIFRRLAQQPASGAVVDIKILDPARSVEYYSGRWVTPRSESGNYVARRPQAFGASLWGVAKVTEGIVTNFLDFPTKGSRWRGCDHAWHLQMAIDYCRGTSQFYRRQSTANGVRLDFFSPVPIWAQRRLAIIGARIPREKCLFSYWIEKHESEAEETFLRSRLWLTSREATE